MVEGTPHFKDPREALGDVVHVGGLLSARSVLNAYAQGIFPWPHEGLPMLWFCPERRGVLDFKDLHLSRSFIKAWRQNKYTLSINRDFEAVIRACQAVPRPGQSGTWITDDIVKVYSELHKLGFAHSVECWDEERLIGGLYGIGLNGLFAGESMFHLKPNASKFCLYQLIIELIRLGHTWMDIQMVTEGLKAWGARYISRDEFLDRLKQEGAVFTKIQF